MLSCCSASILSASSDSVFAASCGCMGVALYITAAGGDKLRVLLLCTGCHTTVQLLPAASGRSVNSAAVCVGRLLLASAASCCCPPPPPSLPMHKAMTTCTYWVIFCQVCPKADRVSWFDLLNALGHWDDGVNTTWTPDSDGVRPCQHCCHRIPVSIRPEACNNSKMPFKFHKML
jgi:hypothetical protein